MKRTRYRGFTLVEIMIVVMIIGILLAIAAPNFLKARVRGRAAAVCHNLREINTAKDEFIMTNQLTQGQNVDNATDLVPTFINIWPTGPVAGSFLANPVGEDPTFQGQNEAWYTQHCMGTPDDLCTL